MSSTKSVLSTLRHFSKPYHDKIEVIGISTELKAGKLSREVYADWLEATGSLILGTLKLLENSEYRPSDLKLPFPEEFPVNALHTDLRAMGRTSEVEPYPFPELKTEDYLVVPVYTLLGSLMGTGMILRYVQKNNPAFPTAFVEQMLTQITLWPKLKSRLDTITLAITDAQLGEYIENYWEVIYQAHLRQQHSVN